MDSPMGFQPYPLGYRSPLNGRRRTEPTGDEGITRLYHQFSTFSWPTSVVQARLETIDAVKVLFGDFLFWLDAQDQNPNISENAYNLIRSTIQYIHTGKRDVSLETYKLLIKSELLEGNDNNSQAPARTTRLRDEVDFQSNEFIYLWLQHRDGFKDMLCTANFLFGKLDAGMRQQ